LSLITCDLETTSLNVFEAEIITGYFCLLDEDLNVVSTKEIRCNPWKWSDEAAAVHGIGKRGASKYKRFTEVFRDLTSWIELSGAREFWCHTNSVMYGKLAPYDYAVLRINMLNMGDHPYWGINKLRPYSTHTLAKVLQGRFDFPGFSLDNICKELGIRLTHHNAESDCRATVEIIKRLLPMTNREELYNYERGINENTEGSRKRNSRKPKSDIRTLNSI
jgi:DNA polymerase III epsilon subunit-like protein